MSSTYWRFDELTAQIADLVAQLNDLRTLVAAGAITDQSATVAANDAIQSQLDDLRASLAAPFQSQIDDLRAALEPATLAPGDDWRPLTVDDLASAALPINPEYRTTSFPSNPRNGQIHHRIDLQLPCFYNGYYWRALNPRWLTPPEIHKVTALWHFAHRLTATIFDTTRRAYDLTTYNSPTYTQLTTPGSIITLNGSNQYLASTEPEFGNFTTASGAIWYYPTGDIESTVQALMSNDKTGARGWMLSHGHDGRVQWQGNNVDLASAGVQDSINTWYLSWWTYNAGDVNVYRYANQDEDVLASGACAIGACDDSFNIGRRALADSEHYFTGRLAAPLFSAAVQPAPIRLYKFLCERPLLG